MLPLRVVAELKEQRSAELQIPQDDDFVGVLTKNIPNKLALMERSPG